MQKEEITALFDQQAATYDRKWSELAPINGALHLLAGAVLAQLPAEARILCVGAGTGAEIIALAKRFPGWHFTAVEPSAAMLDVFHRRAEEQGIAARCHFHPGYLESLPKSESGAFDAATAFLVSQFILDRHERVRFFGAIAERLRSDGILIASDLAGDLSTAEGESQLNVWLALMKGGGVAAEEVARMREAYTRDVAVLAAQEVREIILRAGFESPVPFFQAGMIHAWYARRGSAAGGTTENGAFNGSALGRSNGEEISRISGTP